MGSSASKATRTAAGASARKYPSRPAAPNQATPSTAPPQPTPAVQHRAGPTVHPRAQASATRSESINLDASDPDFARSLRQLGAVQPNPTLSPSSTFDPSASFPSSSSSASERRPLQPIGPDPRNNPALMMLSARSRLQGEADTEFMAAGKRGHGGRQFLDVLTIRQILSLRDQKAAGPGEIERRLGLKSGVVGRLGERGVFGII